jgi:broad specificity phosphatase PhoE
MKSLFLVRHGQDEDNARHHINGRRDTELTELGRTQASTIAAQLSSIRITTVYTSPLRRSRQTADIIAAHLGIQDIREDSDLIEREYGILTGVSVSEIRQIATRVLLIDQFQHVLEAPGVETYSDLWARAGRVLERIGKRHSQDFVLIVAHNEINKMIRAKFCNTSWEQELQLPPMQNCEVIALDGAGAEPQ